MHPTQIQMIARECQRDMLDAARSDACPARNWTG